MSILKEQIEFTFTGLSFHADEPLRNHLSRSYIRKITENHCYLLKNLGTYTNQFIDLVDDHNLVKLLSFNGINVNEYKFIQETSDECVKIYSQMFKYKNLKGQHTVGSSEAIAIALINFLSNWKSKSLGDKPKIIIGKNTHTIIPYLAKILSIDVDYVECNKGLFKINTDLILKKLGPEVIGIILTLGNTYTGEIDDIAEVNSILKEYNNINGIKIPIHVDAASGGFIIPFSNPYYLWDFRLDYVQSINVSSHKYGFTFPTLGWYLYRGENEFDNSIKNNVNYLQGEFSKVSINFSHPIHNLVIQYYNFIKYGHNGYTIMVDYLLDLKNSLIEELSQLPWVNVLNNETALPVINFNIKNSTELTQAFCSSLRKFGWSIPVYPIANCKSNIARIVIRKGMSIRLIQDLIKDFKKTFNLFIGEDYENKISNNKTKRSKQDSRIIRPI